MADHACLRKGKGDKHTNGKERNQLVDAALGKHDYGSRKYAKQNDAIVKGQLVAQIGQLPRHKAIARQDGSQTWKSGKAGLRGHNQDHGGGGLGQQIGPAPGPGFAKYSTGELVNDRGRRPGSLLPINHMKMHRQPGHAHKYAAQNCRHDDQSDGGIF